MFSKTCEYAIRSTLLIAAHSLNGSRVKVKDIAGETGMPEAFTGKVLQQLCRGDIVHSVKGAKGGFEIGQTEMEALRLREIVSIIDGDRIFTGCGLGLTTCNEQKPCPMHRRFASVRNDLKAMLTETTVLELALGLKDGLTFLKR